MTYYPDGAEIPASAEPPRERSRLAFGWLDAEHGFTPGDCSAEVRGLLTEAARNPVSRTRSWYQCPFCPNPGLKPTVHVAADGSELLLGNATIEVEPQQGRTWRAPSLVLHYIAEHHYAPPADFISDVVRGV